MDRFISSNEPELRCTQSKLCLPIIDRIYRKLLHGVKFSAIKVDDNLICDGHHRYLAACLANVTIERIPYSRTLATVAVDWSSVVFIEEDWDTAAKVEMLNEQDARYNNMSVQKLVELLK